MKIQILGTEYEIIVKKYDEDESFKKDSIDGYCSSYSKQIVVCDMSTKERWGDATEHEALVATKQTIRHEIVHAFLSESGLAESSAQYSGGWATFEEMVDWIAIQAPKMHQAFVDAGAL